jgi:tape measure domain-containing protein
MSKTVDERVVEMRFDNRQFEQNVATTMSTLDKFKQKLNFRGATKGLDEVGAAASKVDMRGLGSGVETVTAKFSALQVMGVTALANITNSAVNTGKRLVSALTIDQVTAGWNKYEQKTASVQTIMNATGKSIEEVNGYLDKLMWYSDETSYGFTDMTQSLGQLTSAGGDIEKLIPMIEGIANATAFAGKGASEFSRAIYNLNQSYSAGYLQYMDWKSLDLAGVSSKQLKQVFIDTAKALGKLDAEGRTAGGTLVELSNFGQTLQDKWADTEVMEAAFGKFSELTEAAYKAVRSGEYDTASEAIAALADKYDEISVKAFASAQEAKSFTEAIEATKDAVSSGWMNTAELIFGNYDEAKKLWTDMANSLWDIFASGSESRNAVLGDALNSKWDVLLEKMQDAGVSAEDFQDKLKETAKEHGVAIDDLIDEYGSLGKVISAGKLSKNVIVDTIKKFADNVKTVGKATEVTTDKLEHFQSIVNKVIRGDFGNGAERMEKLAKAGENYATVQALVNKVWERNGKNWSDTTIKAEDLVGVINNLSESELKSMGYTDEQAKALKELAKEAEKTGTPLSELIESLERPSGRELLFSSIHNALEGVAKLVQTFRDAWGEIFTGERMSAGIYNFLDGLNRLSEKLIMSDETADKLKRTLKGLIAIFDIIQMTLGGGIRLAFKVLSSVLEAFDLDILDVTASIGDTIVRFRDWVESVLDVGGVFKKILPHLMAFVVDIKKLFQTVRDSKVFKKFIGYLQQVANWFKKLATLDVSNWSFDKLLQGIKDAFASLPDHMKEIGENIIEGLQNGFGDRFSKIVDKARELATKIIDTIKNVLGIHSPSTVMFEIGQNIVAGLINGIASGIKFLVEGVADLGKKIIDFVKGIDFTPLIDAIKSGFAKIKKAAGNFDWKKLLAIIPIGVVLLVVKELYDFSQAVSQGMGSISSVIDGFTDIEKSFAKVLNAKAFETTAEALKKIATSIAILAASVLVLTQVDSQKLYTATAIIFVLAVTLAVLAKAMAKMQSASAILGKDGLKLAGVKTGLLTLSAAILILAATVKLIGGLDPEQAKQGFLGLVGVILALVVVYAAIQAISMIPGKNIDLVGSMMLKIAVVIGLMAMVCKLVARLSPDEMKRGAIFAAGFLVFVALLNTIALLPSHNISKLGGMLLKISIAIGLMVAVCKLTRLLTPEDIASAEQFLVRFLLFVGGLVTMTSMAPDKKIASIGGLLISISLSMMLMVGVCKLAGQLSSEEIGAGVVFMAGFLVFVALLVAITQISNETKTAKIAGTLLAMSAAVAILAGVAVLLSMLDPAGLANGVMAVVMLSLGMAAMAAAAKGAQKCVGNIIALAIAVGIMAGAVAALTLLPEPDRLDDAVMSMVIVMGMFALIMKMAQSMPTVTGTLFAMAAAMAVLGGVLYLLGTLPVESSNAAAISLSIAMLAFAAAMRIISGMAAPSTQALIAIGVMAVVVALLAGVLYLLRDLEIGQAMDTVIVLGIFLGILAGVTWFISTLQASSLLGVAALAIVTVLVGALAAVLYFLQGIDPTQAMGVVKAIITFMAAMMIVVGLCAAIGPLAIYAIPGLLVLVGFIAVLGLVVAGLAALAMDVIAGMPKLGSDLAAFMTNVQPFIDGIQNIPDDISDKIGKLTSAILKLTGTEILDAIANFCSGGNSIADLGNELKAFGEGMASFTAGSANIDAAVASMSKIKDLQSEIADVDLSQLSTIASELENYSVKVSGLNIAMMVMSTAIVTRLASLVNSLSSMDPSGIANFDVAPLGQKLASYSASVSVVNLSAVSASIVSAIRLRDFINSLAGFNGSGVESFKAAVSQLGTISINEVISSFRSGVPQLTNAGSDLINAAVRGMRSAQGSIAQTVRDIVSVIRSAFISQNGMFVSVGKNLASAFIKGLGSKKAEVNSTALSLVSSASGKIRLEYSEFYDAGVYLGEGLVSGLDSKIADVTAKAAAMAKAAVDAIKEAAKINSPSKETEQMGEYMGQGLVNGLDAFADAASDSGFNLGDSVKSGLSEALSGIQDTMDIEFDDRITITPVLDMDKAKAKATEFKDWLVGGTNTINGNVSSNAMSKIDKLQAIVDKVWRGDYGNGETRNAKLTGEGYDYKLIQDLVNKTADGHKLTVEDLPSELRDSLNSMNTTATAVTAISSAVQEKALNNSKIEGLVSSGFDNLRKDISKIEKPSYVINGITYDDGSAISDTVKALIRGAMIERRV